MVVAVLMSAVAAFFYFRVVVLMFFSAPAADGPSVVVPSPLTTLSIALGTGVTLREEAKTMHENRSYWRVYWAGAAMANRCALSSTWKTIRTSSPPLGFWWHWSLPPWSCF